MALFRLALSLFLLAFMIFDTEGSIEYKFGSKTPYHHGDLNSIPDPPNCRPVHLNMVLRHGARFPSGGDKKGMIALTAKLNKIYTNANPYTYRNLTLPWTLPKYFAWVMKTELSPLGEKEHYGIGKRFVSRFPEVFNKSYWNAFYKFVTTDSRRTAQSAVAFAYGALEDRGMLGRGKYQPVAVKISGPDGKDRILRPYDACQRYIKEIDDGPGMDEYKRFANRTEMRQIMDKITTRLNLIDKMTVSADDVDLMYNLCSFGTFNDQDSSWCSLFDEADFKVLEYNGDLEGYYENGFGNKLSYEIACPLVSEIVNSLQDFTKNYIPYGIFRFAHSGTLSSLMSRLGMFNDSLPLKADNYNKQSNRKFKVGQNIPLAANLAFVLYQCNSSNAAGKYRVRALLNEAPAPMPCCPSNGTCTLSDFSSCIGGITKGCDFDAICSLPTTGRPTSQVTTRAPHVCKAAELHVMSMSFLLLAAVLLQAFL